MQGKLCHPENECEPSPEFVFLAFDGKIVQEHGKKKVSESDITYVLLYLRIVLNICHLGNFIGEDKLIFTMDITSLYTVIPNCEGLLALKHFFDLRTVKKPSSETLLRLAELVLTLNCFSFAGSYYKQINGVAISTKMGSSYANLFVGYIEHEFFNQYNGPKPDLYRRYIDDCVGATSSTREELNQFITAVNSFHPALKYTWEISDTSGY